MDVKKFTPRSNPNELNTIPFVRSSRGEGCGLAGCECSPGFWLSVSNGEVGLRIYFDTLKEMESCLGVDVK